MWKPFTHSTSLNPNIIEIPTRLNPILWGSIGVGSRRKLRGPRENRQAAPRHSLGLLFGGRAIFPTFRFLAILKSTVETMQWAEAHFFIGLSMKREDAISRIAAIAEQAAHARGASRSLKWN